MRLAIAFLFFGLILLSSNQAEARQSVTFNVNMKPQLEDSTFVPGRDQLQIVGNIPPINSLRPYYLIDSEPIDSVYSVTINFPARFRNQTISYNFEMTANYRKYTEVMERNVRLLYNEVSLDALYFNAFAW
ncbi:MAG: hypothetical protein ED557_02790 [Balneola sp.]|nr:MAG: hypothetical protein ED557_02790 [Balneola sp.]